MKKVLVSCLSFALLGGICVGILFWVFGTKKQEVIHRFYPYVSQEELAERADLIVRGQFVSHSASYQLQNVEVPTEETGFSIDNFTMYQFKIDEVIKGAPYNSETINIRVNAAVDRANVIDENLADIKEGAEYLAFLFKKDGTYYTEEGDYYLAFQCTRGFFTLDTDMNWRNQDYYSFAATGDLKYNILEVKRESDPYRPNGQ